MMSEYRLLGRETKALRCILTEAELLERGDQAANLSAEAGELEAERDSENKRLKGEIAQREDQVNLLLREVREKATTRPVECEIRLDFDSRQVETVRLDTGEPFKTRPATKEELQGKLFPIGEAAGL